MFKIFFPFDVTDVIYKYGHVALQKKDGHGQDMTLEDLYNDEVTFSDEDDDSDWDPVEKPTANVGSSGTTSCLDVQNTGKPSGTCASDTTRDHDVTSQQEVIVVKKLQKKTT